MMVPDKGEDSGETPVPRQVVVEVEPSRLAKRLGWVGESGSEGKPRSVLVFTEEEALNVGVGWEGGYSRQKCVSRNTGGGKA